MVSENAKREIKRKPNRAVTDVEEAYSFLDEGYIAHVGFDDPDTHEPTVIPIAYARDNNRILLHGSTGSRAFMAFKAGVRVCATVTHLDAMVAGRSPFNSSMNYRSVMIFGTPRTLEGDEKIKALYVVSEHLIPGLWDAGREMTTKEYAQTAVAEISLDDMTAKKRAAGALDDEDAALPIWAGQIPMRVVFGEPITNEDAKHVPVPDYIKRMVD